jgi:copper chaperone
VKQSVRALNGVSKVEVDLHGKKVTVVYDSEKVELDAIEKTIENSGYDVV